MTNHATMTREEAAAKLVAMMSTDMSLHLTMRRSDARSAAIDALTDKAVGLILQMDALTREAALAQEYREERDQCLDLATKMRVERDAQAERIKALKEVVNYYLDPNGMDSPTNIKAMEAKARAALAPKEAQG